MAPSKNKEAEKKEAVVGMTGGKVELTSGSSVTIPPGALPDNTTITATEAPEAPTPMETTVVGTPVVFGPEGQQFTQPVMVTLTFDPSKLPAGMDASHVVIFTAPVGSTTFTNLGGTLVDATHVQAATTHFSVFAPGVADSTGSCAVCAGGRCASSCPSGTASCDGVCQNTQSDSRNCGTCGHACGQNQACYQGTCVESCFKSGRTDCASSNGGCCEGSVMCSGACADLQTDPHNCGACGTACNASEQCVAGACAPICANGAICFQGLCAPSCPSGSSTCDGACVETQHDPSNCGSCGHACGQGEGCFQGACVPSCGGARTDPSCGGRAADGGLECCEGSTQCGQTCANLQSDRQNCGGCGHACGNEEVCRAGACGPLCEGTSICFQGLCVGTCPTGSSLCGGSCVTTSDDSTNCGACGTTCASGQACFQGACVDTCGQSSGTDGGGIKNDGGEPSTDAGHGGECSSNADCGSSGMCVAGRCVPFDGDGGTSQDCHTQGCSSGMQCYPDGVCRPGDTDGGMSCPTGTSCSGQCTDLRIDRHNCGACGVACGAGQSCDQGHCVGGPVDGGGPVGCQVNPCPSGFRCLADGSCQPGGATDAGGPVSCAADGDCQSGEVCVDGTCKQGGPTGCQLHPCPSGFMCRADGSCEPDGSIDAGSPVTCATDTDCQGGEVCVAGICKVGGPTGCQIHPCPSGFMCRADGSCEPDGSIDAGSPVTCATDTDCQGGEVCVAGICKLGGPTGCQLTPCTGGLICQADGSCQPDGGSVDAGTGPACTTNVECGPHATCIEGTCHPSEPTGCQINPCASGFHCMADGSCQPDGAMDGGSGPACAADADCGPNGACVNGTCHSTAPDGGASVPCDINAQCAVGEVCLNHSCTPGIPADGGAGCPAPAILCNEACVDLNHDRNNCGACGNVCPGGNFCSAGTCTPGGATDGGTGPMCTTDSMCPPQFSCVAEFCTPNQTDGGGVDAGSPPVVCNELPNVAPVVHEMNVAEALPVFTGGAIQSGTYVTQSVVVYTGPGGPTGPTGQISQTTVVLDGSSAQMVSDSGGSPFTLTFSWTASDNNYTISLSCPPDAMTPPPFKYTVSGNTLVLFNGRHVETFLRQ